MNLYKVMFRHFGPKDSEEGIKTFLFANNEDEVYDYIDEKYNYCGWEDQEEEGEMYNVYDDDGEVIGEQTFREKIIKIKGEINDEYFDYSDLFYGLTLFGWELVKENMETKDYRELIELYVISNGAAKIVK